MSFVIFFDETKQVCAGILSLVSLAAIRGLDGVHPSSGLSWHLSRDWLLSQGITKVMHSDPKKVKLALKHLIACL